jgi:hypothetical protein
VSECVSLCVCAQMCEGVCVCVCVIQLMESVGVFALVFASASVSVT